MIVFWLIANVVADPDVDESLLIQHKRLVHYQSKYIKNDEFYLVNYMSDNIHNDLKCFVHEIITAHG